MNLPIGENIDLLEKIKSNYIRKVDYKKRIILKYDTFSR